MSEKEWRDIPSLPEYEASSEGTIRSKITVKPVPNGGMREYGGKEQRGVWCDVHLRFNIMYKRKNYKVHRLVCEAFHGPKPFDGAVVMHIDDNPANNRPDNLRWGTQKENLNTPQFLELRSKLSSGKFVSTTTIKHRLGKRRKRIADGVSLSGVVPD